MTDPLAGPVATDVCLTPLVQRGWFKARVSVTLNNAFKISDISMTVALGHVHYTLPVRKGRQDGSFSHPEGETTPHTEELRGYIQGVLAAAYDATMRQVTRRAQERGDWPVPEETFSFRAPVFSRARRYDIEFHDVLLTLHFDRSSWESLVGWATGA